MNRYDAEQSMVFLLALGLACNEDMSKLLSCWDGMDRDAFASAQINTNKALLVAKYPHFPPEHLWYMIQTLSSAIIVSPHCYHPLCSKSRDRTTPSLPLIPHLPCVSAVQCPGFLCTGQNLAAGARQQSPSPTELQRPCSVHTWVFHGDHPTAFPPPLYNPPLPQGGSKPHCHSQSVL